MDDQTTRIRELNDAARTCLIGCRVMITQGIQAQDDVAAVLGRVRAFDGLCCTNPVRDSYRESSVVAGLHEQTDTSDLQDHELAGL